jgi:hypothetical protein
MERQIQEIVLNYFKNMDDKTVSTVVDAIVYVNPITDRKSKASEVIEKFLKDNGLEKAFLNYMHDYRNESKYFQRASISEIDMIENIKRALLNLSYNRYRALIDKKSERATNFNFMKRTLLEIFECLNNNENYIYGKEDDAKIVAKIEALKS